MSGFIAAQNTSKSDTQAAYDPTIRSFPARQNSRISSTLQILYSFEVSRTPEYHAKPIPLDYLLLKSATKYGPCSIQPMDGVETEVR